MARLPRDGVDSASSWFLPDIVELQLAHQERDKVRAAYNRAERLAERRSRMQQWTDYLDGLRSRSD